MLNMVKRTLILVDLKPFWRMKILLLQLKFFQKLFTEGSVFKAFFMTLQFNFGNTVNNRITWLLEQAILITLTQNMTQNLSGIRRETVIMRKRVEATRTPTTRAACKATAYLTDWCGNGRCLLRLNQHIVLQVRDFTQGSIIILQFQQHFTRSETSIIQ